MRNAFADEITKIATGNKSIVLLSGDIGNRLFDGFKQKAPERFFNCGVAEANMMGVAAGLSVSGLIPVVYTITPFVTYRCFEQIRVDVCYQNTPVIIVGVGSGLGYSTLGPTHHSLEDIACLRSLPNMRVVCPADPLEVRGLLQDAVAHPAPTYIRIGKKGEKHLHESLPDVKIGKAYRLKRGKDIAIISTGTIIPFSIELSRLLAESNIHADITSFHTVKPLDSDYLKELFKNFKVIITVEEHSRIGGFGSAVAEFMIAHDLQNRSKLISIGTDDAFLHECAEQESAQEKLGLSLHTSIQRIKEQLGSIANNL